MFHMIQNSQRKHRGVLGVQDLGIGECPTRPLKQETKYTRPFRVIPHESQLNAN